MNSVEKRIERNNFQQPRHGNCLLCGKDFDTCPHNIGEVDATIQAYRLKKIAGKYLS